MQQLVKVPSQLQRCVQQFDFFKNNFQFLALCSLGNAWELCQNVKSRVLSSPTAAQASPPGRMVARELGPTRQSVGLQLASGSKPARTQQAGSCVRDPVLELVLHAVQEGAQRAPKRGACPCGNLARQSGGHG